MILGKVDSENLGIDDSGLKPLGGVGTDDRDWGVEKVRFTESGKPAIWKWERNMKGI